MDTYNFLRKILRENGIESDNFDFGEEFFSDEIFDILIDDRFKSKGESFNDRFKDIISDPNNLFIKRHGNSGILKDNKITLHNGIEVYNNCYYDNFTDILIFNKGVHEPSEERAFKYVIDILTKNGSNKMKMIELGSYWAFYSIWFKKEFNDSEVFCIEPDWKCLNSGIENFKLNKIEGDFTQGFIGDGPEDINLENFCDSKKIDYIDILHSDIQGYEYSMLCQMKNFFEDKKINYVFLSTHSDEIHNKCIDFFRQTGYRIICSADFEKETYQYDGFILACPENNSDIPSFNIGNRSKGVIIDDITCNEIKK